MASMTAALGVRANGMQLGLLVAVNVFVGAMVGVERSVLPLVVQDQVAVAAWGGAAFVAIFGAAKAGANLSTHRLVQRLGRRNTLLLGWALALPVPLLLGVASSLTAVLAANVLLGVSQGLTWSMTLLMKVDLAGPLAPETHEATPRHSGDSSSPAVRSGMPRTRPPKDGRGRRTRWTSWVGKTTRCGRRC